MAQRTLKDSFKFRGVGIHTGSIAEVTVHPAEVDSGRQFRTGKVMIPASLENVVDTSRCTTLGRDGARISTVEHLLSALYGCGIDNALIEIEGIEIPILDGSARPFVDEIVAAGIMEQDKPATFLHLFDNIQLSDGKSLMTAEPSNEFYLDVITEFDDWPAGTARSQATIETTSTELYAATIAPARTFAFRREVEMLLAAGLAKGGSLDNALVITPPDIYSTPLRMEGEWCMHKLLDIVGDFALLNARIKARISAIRPGHRLNIEFAKRFQMDARRN